jgi:hypothetical protein
VRTLDALHLATLDFLHRRGQSSELASYDGALLPRLALSVFLFSCSEKRVFFDPRNRLSLATAGYLGGDACRR